jgi:hypothetical protein
MKLKTPSQRGWIFAIVLGGITLALPYLLDVEHASGWWEAIPGWWSLFGLIGCAVIVIGSKWLGSLFLNKRRDWYE